MNVVSLPNKDQFDSILSLLESLIEVLEEIRDKLPDLEGEEDE